MMSSNVHCESRRYPLNGVTLAGLEWFDVSSDPDCTPLVLALHGWLDNAASFSRLAPLLVERGFRVIALDLAGHGESTHRPVGADYALLQYVVDLAQWLAMNTVSPAYLVGHSLGGVIGTLYAAACPDTVWRLVMIDSLGPLAGDEQGMAPRLAKALRKRLAPPSDPATYASLEEAVKARAGSLVPLPASVARQFVARSLICEEGSWRWRSDPRTRHPALSLLTEGQVLAALSSIKAPSLLVRARFSLVPEDARLRRRREAVPDLREVVVDGGHHCHLEDAAEVIASHITDFFR